MRTPLCFREFTPEEKRVIAKLSRSQTASARLVERAKLLQLGSDGQSVPHIAQMLGLNEKTIRKWFKRFEQAGLAGLEDAPRSGAPTRYTAENKARVLQAARTRPSELGLPYGSWPFERLAASIREQLGIQMKKTSIFEILQEEGLRWHKQETWFGERLDPEFAQKRGPSKPSARSLQPTASS